MPIEFEVPRKFAGERPDQQNMICLFHNQAGRRNRMCDSFDRSDSSSFESGSFHDCGVHPLYPIQLMIRSSSRVEQSRLFQETDRTFNGGESRTSLREDAVACRERIGQACGLCRRHTSGTGASVGKNERTVAGQLRRRFRAC